MAWIGNAEATNWFNRNGDAWNVIAADLLEGANTIEVMGTNTYGQSTNDTTIITRQTREEAAPRIATNALIFPINNSMLNAPAPTNVIWRVDGITDDMDSTNLTISKISVHLSTTTNQVAIVTNDIANILGQIQWLVPDTLINVENDYVLRFEVVDSTSITNSRIFGIINSQSFRNLYQPYFSAWFQKVT